MSQCHDMKCHNMECHNVTSERQTCNIPLNPLCTRSQYPLCTRSKYLYLKRLGVASIRRIMEQFWGKWNSGQTPLLLCPPSDLSNQNSLNPFKNFLLIIFYWALLKLSFQKKFRELSLKLTFRPGSDSKLSSLEDLLTLFLKHCLIQFVWSAGLGCSMSFSDLKDVLQWAILKIEDDHRKQSAVWCF